MKPNKKYQRGQILLVVIFAVSLGMLVIVHTANRVVASIARVAQSNNYQKALAIAEGGAELFLIKSFSEFTGASGLLSVCSSSKLSNLASVVSSCTYSADEARAYIGVEQYPKSSETELKIISNPGETIQVNLQGLTSSAKKIQVCWRGLGKSNYTASQYFYYYTESGNYKVEKNVFLCNSEADSLCSPPGGGLIKDIQTAKSYSGYSCYAFWVLGDPRVLRIFTLPDGAEYTITAYNDSDVRQVLPPQGYRIISIGEVVVGGKSLDEKRAVRKKVIVEKTFPYPNGPWWDFGISSLEGTIKTSL